MITTYFIWFSASWLL